MKRFTLIIAVLGLGAISAGAQNLADSESNIRNSFWFGSNNAAAMSVRPVDFAKDLKLNYNSESGGLHLQQNPESLNDVSLHTRGDAKVGGFTVQGEFTFQNRFEKGTQYNAIRYEIDEAMPYYVADTCASGWNKQAYLMSVKLASPQYWDLLTFGVKLDYNARVGAKQKDPRCATYKHDVAIIPSATLSFGKNIIGLYGSYTNGFERSVPTNENYRKDQMVFITTGLGEGKVAMVGGNDGLGTIYYRKHIIGAGLEYNHTGDNADLFAELTYANTMEAGFEKPGMPKPMGRINRNTIGAEFGGLFGSSRSHKAELGATVGLTDGTEMILKRDDTPGNPHWEVLAENLMSSFTRIEAHAGYDYMSRKDDGHYDWSVGGNAEFSMRNYSYLIPANSFNATGILMTANGGKQFVKGNSAVLLKAEAGYNLSLGGEYIYSGGTKTALIQKLYVKDIAILNSNYILFGGRASYSINTGRFCYNFDLSARYLKAADCGRLIANLSAGILF